MNLKSKTTGGEIFFEGDVSASRWGGAEGVSEINSEFI
jgi:hypothetical protein